MSKSPDDEYLGGCLISGLAGLAVLAPPIVVAISNSSPAVVYFNEGVKNMVLTAGIVSALLGLVFCFIGKLPARVGVLGGFLCGGAYWLMHIQQLLVKSPSQIGRPTEYPDSTMWTVPLLWVLIGVITVGLSMLVKKNPHQSL